MCDGPRRLETTETNATVSIAQGFMTAEMKAAAVKPRKEESEGDVPYCVHDDFPCEGDEELMVHVCYYSSHYGYQTFCIPEADSDVLRFNNNHYCGPCNGWNGQERTVQMI
jgi:succinate dehydrogenase/fumarate reductase flavoprotein subunit